MSRSAKMVMYNAMIVATLINGTESRFLMDRERQRVQAVRMRVLRKITQSLCEGHGYKTNHSLLSRLDRNSYKTAC